MKLKNMLPLFVLLLFCLGLFFVSKGITGSVVSQSCCFPPDCPEDYLCDFVREKNDSVFLISGISISILGAFCLIFVHHRKIHGARGI